MPFYVAEVIKLEARFTDDAGTAVDPSVPVTVSVWDQGGTLVSNEAVATKQATGHYQHLFTPASAGAHHYRFTSADNSVETGDFIVRANP